MLLDSFVIRFVSSSPFFFSSSSSSSFPYADVRGSSSSSRPRSTFQRSSSSLLPWTGILRAAESTFERISDHYRPRSMITRIDRGSTEEGSNSETTGIPSGVVRRYHGYSERTFMWQHDQFEPVKIYFYAQLPGQRRKCQCREAT